MNKQIAMRPITEKRTYLKYGFVLVRCQACLCPACFKTLNAGSNYQPEYCDQCGQHLTFDDIEWEQDEELGIAERRSERESVGHRVV